ncbi:MAG: phosphatidylserine decarboxylase family protein [Bacteroidota bacterium]|nr:phosphatidylserine decarboxylase family protein [Bacteroidota bacterium]
MFTKYGYFTIGIVSIFSLIIIAISTFFIGNTYVKIFLIAAAVLFMAFTLYFFRDPERTTPVNENAIISPADGKVLFIKDVVDNKYVNEKCKQISIFMSPFNVHVNRIPISGKLEYFKYYKGKFFAAFDDKASTENERAEYGINSANGKMMFTQVAGFMARRLVYAIKQSDSVKVGDRFGMIKFGSRVDVVVPEKWVPKVKQGDAVTAGVTILFELK